MIAATSDTRRIRDTDTTDPAVRLVLVRYGSVPQVARFEWVASATVASATVASATVDGRGAGEQRGRQVVVTTDRGEELGTVLEVLTESLAAGKEPSGDVLRIAAADDLRRFDENQQRALQEFGDWQRRIDEWKLQLQLIDLEWTLDQDRVILYVLNDRGAETTRLALLAAAAGLGIVHVQPVSAEGVIPAQSGGCGSGGCGSGGCG